MKKFVLFLLLLPMVCHAYEDHRGWNLDSLEREAAKWPWSRVERAGKEEVNEYVILVSKLSTAYENLDPERSRYYALADSIFVRNGWTESSSVLHYNMGEINMDAGLHDPARAEYEQALGLATQAGDSLLLARAQYGLGRYHQATGRTRKALEELTAACTYFEAHSLEETVGLKDTLAVMNAAHEELYRNARMLAIGAFLVLLLTIGGTLLVRRLRLTRQELTETSAVLDETIEELRPAVADGQVVLTDKEKAIARLLVEGKSTKEIAEAVHLGVNTVLWYRKRLYAKFDVHNAAAFSTEMSKRGLLE